MGRRFHIDALFWVDSVTEIHQHAFRGAFQVLAGGSIQTSYSFARERVITGELQVGRLHATESKLLRAGDVEPIRGGDRSIHALFHLMRPSVSLVVRTKSEQSLLPQYSYLPPGIAYDALYSDPHALRTVQMAELLCALDDPRFEERLVGAIARSDLHTCFLLLKKLRSLPDRSLFARLVDAAAQRHGAIAQTFAAAFEEMARQESIVHKRTLVKDPELRFFLALLLHATSRQPILELTRAHVPHRDPIETVLGWLVALSKVTLKLQLGGTPWEPNAFGLPTLDDTMVDVIRRRLRGEPLAAIGEPRFRQLFASLGSTSMFRGLSFDSRSGMDGAVGGR
ncbi:hypothetical protein [Pendulispora albinea]|uniref:Uncharacterized protein n=1 Tax=Pendulispora albinea TaxID=2741071 RepID=A0ABZ2LRH7_9BACT